MEDHVSYMNMNSSKLMNLIAQYNTSKVIEDYTGKCQTIFELSTLPADKVFDVLKEIGRQGYGQMWRLGIDYATPNH